MILVFRDRPWACEFRPMSQFVDFKRYIVPTFERANTGSIWIHHLETEGRQYVVRVALIQCSDAPVAATFSAPDLAFLAPMLKRLCSGTFFEDYTTGKTFVKGDAVVPDQSKVGAACTFSVTVQTPAIKTSAATAK